MNILLYPLDYPSEISDAADNASFALENAVTLLEVQSRDTAIRQALNRRVSGQTDSSLQNRLCRARPVLMPLTRIGSRQVPAPVFLGTIAYLGGGRSHGGAIIKAITSFSLTNDTIAPTGFRLSDGRTYMGTVGNQSSAMFCGGVNLQGLSGTVDELSYRQVSIRRVGSGLTIPIFCGAGMGNKSIGVLLGGIDAAGVSLRHGERVTYGNEPTFSSLGNILATSRAAPHNGTSTPTTGFVYGGGSGLFFSLPILFSIESFNFSTLTTAPVGSNLVKRHIVHAAVGGSTKGYLLGGSDNPPASPFGAEISAFTYSGQTLALLGITLPDAKVCSDGIGSSGAGYGVGGDTATSQWQGSTSIDKLTYDTEAISRIGATLPDPTADQGGIGDYGAGFST